VVHSHFSVFDWFIVLAFLVFYGWLGLSAKKRAGTLDDFLVMGRKLGPIWGVATLSATETGLVTLIYFAEEAYLSGFVALILAGIAALTMWMVGWTGFVIRKLREQRVRTVPEYLETRFNVRVRWIAGLASFLVGVLNLGIFLQVEGSFLTVIMGLKPRHLPLVMGVMLTVVLAYTALGGMFSVVLTDVVQFVLIVLGVTVTSFLVIHAAGGWSNLVAVVATRYGSGGFTFWDSHRYGVQFLLWSALYYLAGWSSWQPVVARVLSMRDIETGLHLFRLSSVFMFLRAAVPMIWGIGALAIVGTVTPSSAALQTVMVRILPAGLIGLTTVAFVSATMSTFSSYFLAFSSILLQDVIAPVLRNPPTDALRVRMMQICTVGMGIVIYFWASFYHFPESVFRYLTLTGSISYAALLTTLVGGIYWKRAGVRGAYLAFAASAVFPAVSLAWPRFSPTLAGLLSFVLAPVGMIVGSLWSRAGGKGDRLADPAAGELANPA
jgi:solute:Na+ symporter, SSS family